MDKINILAACMILALLASCKRETPFSDMIDTSPKWSVTLEKLDASHSESRIESSECEEPKIAIVESSTIFTYENIGEKDINLVFSYGPSKDGKSLELKITVENFSKDVFVKCIQGPDFSMKGLDFENYTLYTPLGLGFRIAEAPSEADHWLWSKDTDCFFYEFHASTSYSTMSWFTFEGKGEKAGSGIYVCADDPDFRPKSYGFKYYPKDGNLTFAPNHFLEVFPGEKYSCPALQVKPYKGDWHEASRMYRIWFDSHHKIADQPEWLKNCSGWLLAILKQQNEEIIWDYASVGRELRDIADQNHLDIVGLFGWAHGGHDRFYPDYIPDPEMGGPEVLKESISGLHKMGKRAIIYANGHLIDQNGTNFWEDTGIHITAMKADSTFYYETWHKYSDTPARVHGTACMHTDIWRQKLLDLALQANSLGADGIIYDQLGYESARFCYSPEHGHRVPAICSHNDKFEMLDWLRSEMSKVNPDFIIITEGLSDIEMTSCAMFHGCTFGTFMDQDITFDGINDGRSCPEMFRYTFPEIKYTIRNATPANERRTINYATLFGLMDEIECRYEPDRKYLQDGVIPTSDDYGTILSKPDLSVVLNNDRDEMRNYSSQVIEFQRKYRDVLWNGRFADNEGMDIQTLSPDLIAKVFKSGKHSAVVVWNQSSDKTAQYSVKVKGKRFVSIESPDRIVKPADPIAPQSIHLLMFK